MRLVGSVLEQCREYIHWTWFKYHQSVIDNAREAEKTQAGRPLAIALDTKGPEIRTGNTTDNKDFPIKEGHVLNITTDEQYAASSDDQNMLVDPFGPEFDWVMT